MRRWKTNGGMQHIDPKWLAKNKIDIKQMARNILAVYDMVLAHDRIHGTNYVHQGQTWYDETAQMCEEIGLRTTIGHKKVAYVVAVTSNNIYWSNQKKLIEPFITWVRSGKEPTKFKCGIMDQYADKAAQIILHGTFAACSGPKVQAFARNLCREYHIVTIDRHALRIALGYGTDDMLTTTWVRPGPRRKCVEAAYHLAARCRNIQVAFLQAITWVGVTENKTIREVSIGKESTYAVSYAG